MVSPLKQLMITIQENMRETEKKDVCKLCCRKVNLEDEGQELFTNREDVI